eukprot:9337107-Ditylum_brightwellii.AAC.1
MIVDEEDKNRLGGFDEVPNLLKIVTINPDPMDLAEMGSHASKHTRAKLQKLGRRSEGKKCLKKGALVVRNLADNRKVEPAIEDKQLRKTMREQIKKGLQAFAKGKGTSDPAIKVTIQNLFSSSKQVSLTKT